MTPNTSKIAAVINEAREHMPIGGSEAFRAGFDFACGYIAGSIARVGGLHSDLDELLIVAHLSPQGEDESDRAAIVRLIAWELQIALDPAVSQAAQALIDKGREQP